MKLNTTAPARPAPRTHEGAVAARISPLQELTRTVSACLLWEDSFYESGTSIADRIKALVPQCDPAEVGALAIRARTELKLRHVPLLLVRELARARMNVAWLLRMVIQRPDELAEFMAIYWAEGKSPVAESVKRGLAGAFTKFDAYQLAKYNRDAKITLRDVLFICHAKPRDEAQAAVFRQLVDGTLAAPDTWEVALSGGADKKTTWERLLAERKLGGLALLRNLRNMVQAGVPEPVINAALNTMKPDRVLPFRFLSAAKHAPSLEPALEAAMFRCLGDQPQLDGRTMLVVDASGSMFGTTVSTRSEIDRFEAAAALAILLREVCANVAIMVYSNSQKMVPARRGFALRDVMYANAERGGTATESALMAAKQAGYDRIIVITDEQSHQTISTPLPDTKAYFINVGTYQNGIGYGKWVHIDGWSESVINFIRNHELGVTGIDGTAK
jgi:60 kDa SS-A/Ro ribonucleoprotein